MTAQNCQTCKYAKCKREQFPCCDCLDHDRWEGCTWTGDTISRQAAIDALGEEPLVWHDGEDEIAERNQWRRDVAAIMEVPSAQPEPLTDKEQRIFLAAMEREEKVCEEVDRNYVREPYEDSLMRVCKEIRRKVKGALWIQ